MFAFETQKFDWHWLWLPTPEIRGSDPVIEKLYITYILFTDDKKEKEAENGPLLNQFDLNTLDKREINIHPFLLTIFF